jgi:hypothetical protein
MREICPSGSEGGMRFKSSSLPYNPDLKRIHNAAPGGAEFYERTSLNQFHEKCSHPDAGLPQRAAGILPADLILNLDPVAAGYL